MEKKSYTERLIRRIYYKYFGRNVFYELQIRARNEAADYISNHLHTAVIYERNNDMLRDGIRDCVDGAILEFGVASGGSIRVMGEAAGTKIVHGFDSFEGLPEDWTGHLETRGAFSQKGKLPEVPGNVRLHKGWFDETLGKWTAENPDKVGFLHVDCDLYSSTMTILEGLKDRLQVGTIITFDEYLNYPGWRVHEYKAWQEFTEAQKISYDYIAFGAKNGPASVKITAIG
ncbi:MAG: TylF/MycF/NovP-related O-methyltransferase [Pseudomonadota bacterium]